MGGGIFSQPVYPSLGSVIYVTAIIGSIKVTVPSVCFMYNVLQSILYNKECTQTHSHLQTQRAWMKGSTRGGDGIGWMLVKISSLDYYVQSINKFFRGTLSDCSYQMTGKSSAY